MKQSHQFIAPLLALTLALASLPTLATPVHTTRAKHAKPAPAAQDANPGQTTTAAPAPGGAAVPAPADAAASAPKPGALNVPTPPPPSLTAKSWVLMDFATGQVLADANADERVEPASITKVMTSYVVSAELAGGKIKMTDEVFISETAWRSGGAGTEGSTSFLALNSKVPLKDLFYGMVIQSGNDAAIALAEHIAGSEATFAELMNQYAGKLGMSGTHFTNASGLPDANHYTTARDIALLSRALIRDFPEEYKIYSIKDFEWNGIKQHNRNSLLWRDSSVDGIKTGHTKDAGFCLTTSAKRGDQRLIAVVMGTSSEKQRADENQALLNYGFRFYETHKLYEADKTLAQPELWKGASNSITLGVADDVVVSMPRGRYKDLKATMDMPSRLIAPFTKGQQVGTIRIALDGKPLAERPLVALADAPAAGFWGRTSDSILLWFKGDKKSDVSALPDTK